MYLFANEVLVNGGRPGWLGSPTRAVRAYRSTGEELNLTGAWPALYQAVVRRYEAHGAGNI